MKRIIAMLLAVMMVFALCACGDSNTDSGNDTASDDGAADLTFVTGGEQGTYYAFGTVLAQLVSDKTATNVTAVSGKGSQANVEDLQAGAAELGFVQSDVMSYAYNGEKLFTEKVTDFSVVAALYMEQVQIVTLDSSISSVADLKGKTVSIGAKGSGVYFNALDILGAYGLTEDDIKAEYLDFGDSADSLKDGKIDAAFVVAGAPTPAVQDLGTSKQVYLVSLDSEHIDSLIETSPYYKEYTISKDVYNTPEDVTTVAVAAVVIARNDVSEAAIYNFVSTIFENIDEISHAKKSELDVEFASSISDVPYHPGAAKYFAEKGITVEAAA